MVKKYRTPVNKSEQNVPLHTKNIVLTTQAKKTPPKVREHFWKPKKVFKFVLKKYSKSPSGNVEGSFDNTHQSFSIDF